eukprot:GFUD01076105.1.p1 GENE.GFUD01076105.1~~GFUD01076105.1.p1  ORF type:complete len:155 (-),score=28.16 GFUD01076105.1:2-433(-)
MDIILNILILSSIVHSGTSTQCAILYNNGDFSDGNPSHIQEVNQSIDSGISGIQVMGGGCQLTGYLDTKQQNQAVQIQSCFAPSYTSLVERESDNKLQWVTCSCALGLYCILYYVAIAAAIYIMAGVGLVARVVRKKKKKKER